MTWKLSLAAVVLGAFLGSAWSMWAHEPGDAVGPMRKAEVGVCSCVNEK